MHGKYITLFLSQELVFSVRAFVHMCTKPPDTDSKHGFARRPLPRPGRFNGQNSV